MSLKDSSFYVSRDVVFSEKMFRISFTKGEFFSHFPPEVVCSVDAFDTIIPYATVKHCNRLNNTNDLAAAESI